MIFRVMLSVLAAADQAEPDCTYFELGFTYAGGSPRREALMACAAVRFEDAAPVRAFRWSRRLGYFPGLWWSETTGEHVGYESWLERDHLRALDFDPDIVGIASQPFWLHWRDDRGARRHAPDFFARRADGTGVVIDVRPDDRIEPRDAEAFAATALACGQAGWEFRRVGEIDPVLGANVRWLSRYRHRRWAGGPDVVRSLREAFAAPTPLLAGAADVSDTLVSLPALFHMMWHQDLVADLAETRLDAATLVRGAPARAGDLW
jgi:hypothetical protein